jgi:hypothetical protein
LKLINNYGIPIFLLFLAGVFFAPAISALVFSGLCALVAIEMRRTLRGLRNEGIEAIAKIERFESDSDGDPIPVMSFETSDGIHVKGRPSFVLESGRGDETGKEYAVLYRPDVPTEFVRQKDEGQARIAYYLLLVLMVLIATAGIADLIGYINIETGKPDF